MADNTQLPSGAGGDIIRDKDRAGIKTQVVGIDLGIGTGSESLMTGKMPITSADGDQATIGALADAKVTGDNTGSLSAKLRGLLYEVGDQADAASLTTSLMARLRQLGVLLNGGLPAALGAGGGLKVDGSGTALPVTLPAGQAVELLDSGGTNKASISAGGAVKVDNSGVTQPVQGKPTYAAAAAITITLASLGATSGREGTAIDNSTNLYEDVLVFAQLKSNAVSANDTVAYIYVAGSINDGSDNWPDAVTGSDAAITVNSPTQLKLLGVINFGAAGAAAGTFKGGPWSVAALFGGTLPKKWSIVVVNSNAALTATGGDHKIIYQGVNR